MVQNVQYSNGPPIQVTLPFEYRTPMLSSIQVFGIQMMIVLDMSAIQIPTVFIPEHPLHELGLHNRSSFFENFSNWKLLHLHHQVRKVKLPENHKKNFNKIYILNQYSVLFFLNLSPTL